MTHAVDNHDIPHGFIHELLYALDRSMAGVRGLFHRCYTMDSSINDAIGRFMAIVRSYRVRGHPWWLYHGRPWVHDQSPP